MALTKAEIAEQLYEELGLNKREAKEFVEIFFGEISDILVEGSDVKISGFGNFILRDKKARPGRNPKTGEDVEISSRRVVTFRAGQKLKERVKDVYINIQKKIPTIPVTLETELETNSFLRCDDTKIKDYLKMDKSNKLEVFTELRKLKDNF